MKRVTFCQVLLYCALIVCTFLGNFKSFWKYKSMSFLIIITMLTNNSSNFCSSLKFLHFDLLSGVGGTTIWTIFMHPFLFFVLLVRVNWQVCCRNSFQLLNFLPDSKQPFCNTVPFSGKEESSAGLSTLPVLPGVSQS